MDKKYLRNLPREQAEPSFLQIAGENEKVSWLLTASKEGNLLQVTVYSAQKLREGDTSPRYRCFFDEYDYITQDLVSEKTKWLTGKMSSIFAHDWYGTWDWRERRYAKDRLVVVSGKDTEVMRSHFDSKSKYPGSDIWGCIDRWQNTIQDRKLEARRDKELQHTREMMELVPPLPEDFDSWIDGYAMRDKRYLVYDGDRKKDLRRACCTHCGQLMEINAKRIRLRMNALGTCPECGSTVTLKPFKRLPRSMTDRKSLAIIQRLDTELILVRYFNVGYVFRKDDLLGTIKKSRYLIENCREFLSGSGKNRKKESFEFAVYKQKGEEQWCPDVGAVSTGTGVLYTKGLRETLAGTDWQYSGLEAFQETEGCLEIPVWRYLDCYPDNKDLEILVKAGLTSLASELVRDPWTWRNGTKSRRGIPGDLKKLSKEHRRILRDLNGGSPMISTLRELELCRDQSNAETVKEYIRTFGSERQLITDLSMLGIKLRKFTRYTKKQTTGSRVVSEVKRRERVRNFVHDWKDYIGWCRDLGYNLHDEYVLMPPDFRKAHDRVMEEEKRKKDEILRKKQEKMNRQIHRILMEMQESDPLHMQTKSLMIVVPSSADDIRREGQELHHCVGMYVERVAKGETMILFVRRTAFPEIPYFTMEWKDGEVKQCRGSRNCDMPADVKAFVKAFEKRMQEELEEKSSRQRVRVS